jgi:poly(A) polymerase
VLQQTIDLEHDRHPGAAPDVTLRLAALCTTSASPRPKLEPGGASASTTTTSKVRWPQAPAGAALRHRHDLVGHAARRAASAVLRLLGGRLDRFRRPSLRADAGAELERLHILTRADVTTQQRKAARLSAAYDDIERRIAELAAQEELDAMRPELDGNRIQEVLGIGRA